jgi:hypothetical protein
VFKVRHCAPQLSFKILYSRCIFQLSLWRSADAKQVGRIEGEFNRKLLLLSLENRRAKDEVPLATWCGGEIKRDQVS